MVSTDIVESWKVVCARLESSDKQKAISASSCHRLRHGISERKGGRPQIAVFKWLTKRRHTNADEVKSHGLTAK